MSKDSTCWSIWIHLKNKSQVIIFKDAVPHLITTESTAPVFKFHSRVDLQLPNAVFRVTCSVLDMETGQIAVSGELLEEEGKSYVWTFKVYKQTESVLNTITINDSEFGQRSNHPTLKCRDLAFLKAAVKKTEILWVGQFLPDSTN